MDVKYHAAMSATLALLYVIFLGGDLPGAAIVLLVGIGMDADHIVAYLYYTRDFSAGLLKNTYVRYRWAADWLFFRKGKPYEVIDLMVLHNFEVALLAFFLFGGNTLFFPAAIGYLGHMALDLATWPHIVFTAGTRTLIEALSFFSLTSRLLFFHVLDRKVPSFR